jgi:hypothetical protein
MQDASWLPVLPDFVVTPVYQTLAADRRSDRVTVAVVVVGEHSIPHVLGDSRIVMPVGCIEYLVVVGPSRVEGGGRQSIVLILRQPPVLHLLTYPGGGCIDTALELGLGLLGIDPTAKLGVRARPQMRQQACAVRAVVCVVIVVAAAGRLAFALRQRGLTCGAHCAVGVLPAGWRRGGSCLWCLSHWASPDRLEEHYREN